MSRPMPASRLDPVFVDRFPEPLEADRIYVSIRYNTTAHLCACGCGLEVIAPLSPAQWRFTYDGRNVTLKPSIGNWNLPCQSHYWIDHGRIRWANRFTPDEITEAQQRDATDLRRQGQREQLRRYRWLEQLWHLIRRW
ncbi:DUF6527 family protein [Propioniciclava sinopodophylli]|uniref:DUF6527 family protein n=1 Tax=Propioniciclava sinopodophylli TaxID=1837344 RepID=UPI0013F144F9|nr:DUF6527 family protein [Propioniciclava sinopodophylli]